MKLFVRLLRYVKPYMARLIGALACIIVLSGTTALIAYLVKPAIDGIFVQNSSVIALTDVRDPAALDRLLSDQTDSFEARLLRSAVPAENMRQLHNSVEKPKGLIASGRNFLAQLAEEKLTKKLRGAEENSDEPAVTRPVALKAAAVAAFNALLSQETLYVEHQDHISLDQQDPVFFVREELAAGGLLRRGKDGRWLLARAPQGSESEDLRWFNIALLARLYPDVLIKNQQRDYSMLKLIPLLLILCYLLKGLADFGQNYLIGSAGNRAIMDMRSDLYRHIQGMSLSFFSRVSTGEIMSRISNDVGILRRTLSSAIMKLSRNFFLVIALSAVVVYQNWQMAILCLIVLPAASFPIAILGKKGRLYSLKTQEKMGDLSTLLDETISGNQTVKSYCMESRENARFASEAGRIYRLSVKSVKIGALSSPIMHIFGAVLAAGIIYLGGYQVIQGSMTPGQFFSFIAALALLLKPIKALSGENIKLQRALAAADRIFNMLDMHNDIIEKPGAVELPPLRRTVELRDVWFRYEEDWVLKNLRLSAPAGSVTALVGHSGAGKSTITNLLLRFYDPQQGALLIDGVDIRDATIASLRAGIALVSQETILFNDSVKHNISYGSSDVSDEAVIAAARAAFAHEFIEQMPEGYDTVIGERGVKLSGGQRQRIAIARAIMKDAPLLILDEATSALDTRSEKVVQDALDNLMRGRTTFIIAHRLSTIRNADQILVMADGEVVERGTHDDLVRHSGIYNRLIEIQSCYQKKPAVCEHIV
ncbi:MAG: ABC transporter ATP-binding protein [Deltaproteobacteria bacterium]|nr:ABC transporter ATP-binding protein [Deltaproteobacteria bacterium]